MNSFQFQEELVTAAALPETGRGVEPLADVDPRLL
jgi:hypothetical protein